MFDGKNSKKIEFLEIERTKLWDRVLQLEKLVEEKPSDIEKEAKQALKKASEYRNRIEDRLTEANNMHLKIVEIEEDIDNKIIEITSKHSEAFETSNELIINSDKLATFLDRISEVLEEHPNIEDEIEEIDVLITKIDENSSKANTTYKGILSKKTEIDELHREILGYEDEDENGETIVIDGLKIELENAYDKLNDTADNLKLNLSELEEISQGQYDDFIIKNQESLDVTKTNSKSEYDKINKKIESLLPNALTAGLSSAFVSKKMEEEILYNEYKTNFSRGILYISLAALLPIAISVFYLWSGASLSETIDKAPKVMLAFLPLYIPLIWITISANKKVNLSKRLIEEYSHKQVLSMTIEGLSKQIENIEDSEISEELRIKLLNSFLNVTSENPGKLILDYQKSDNPILNFFDRDRKKGKSIVQTLEDSTKDIIEKAADEIEDGIINNG